MDTKTVPPQEASLTVNEQVIVMSGHETIRVLEVGVDAPLPEKNEGKTVKQTAVAGGEDHGSSPLKPSGTGREEAEKNTEKVCRESGGEAKTLPEVAPAPIPGVLPFSQVTSHQTPTLTPVTVQATPQVLTQENLATVVTGVMVPAGAVTQPLLIPISIAGQVASQQGLAVWTFPAATVAALPGLTAASPTGGIFKSPIANLQAAAVLNTAIQAPLQSTQPVQAQQTVQPRPAVQTQTVFQPQAQPTILPQSTAVSTSPVIKPLETQTQITVQPAGFAFNPGIISAASLGAQTQLLSSLAATPVIANTIPSVQGITGQILTNAQGQVIGTLPWVVNPAGIATANPVPATLPAQNLQLQAVTPQLLLNAQGQVIATLASSTIQAAAAAASVRTPSTPESPAKTEVQPIQPAPPLTQPAVVIASPPPAAKLASAPVPITCSETPTVSQLVSKPQAPNNGSDGDGINLEEIREFAKNFKIRRLSLGLTQTQVGQALTATEGPAYSQSAICRFEKLDITPKSAQKLKPVLEKWLSEAELRNQEGQQNLMEFVGGEPSKKRKRRTSFTPQAIEALNAYFEKNALPTGQEITEIAKELNYDREVVRVWFCNRRQTLKNTSKLNVFQIP
ncbi:POU domain, class 6, transcription factor 1 [Sceloporus undulatus]|uniref:POU domain, class 6, transcription factor 1 n=1 Tax=Sceloporus undulatus TaxID=8520 RepID=UPI001C4CD144|nr:POU domain, class 6, transcription factor 1 [Sceloporus undulatus]XP_042305375.1 POU domain, class 6, transcription factor 1 [Sceloporus undulatus]XP_042305376.1 POU domain, class 6, transcription factor 1 [Sceloporus undulatus]XP_042305377.1 POU domain, class 6, transcription factor 1 [Sceloporus undulatus]XP_042305379.1 POU domain, class 6, transcription factor 1 [Sceloporus undulatus]XP_042305380.1 POU domain, class 6, transcription factor 1 [Sceloporus undulatus]XP_042305381.1 POU doma